MGTLERLHQAGRAHAVVSELTRDPDPDPHHYYVRSPHSGAGNCMCGVGEHHRRHPHAFLEAYPGKCVCTLPPQAKVHREAAS